MQALTMPLRAGLRRLALGALLLAASLGATARDAAQPLRVLACEPEWAALTRELAGPLATVQSATTGLQDPHHVQARPGLLVAVRQADLLVCTGAELEEGWLPLLQRQAGNPAVQPARPGHFEAAAQVALLEVPTRLDRADGDVHGAGNPHIQTDPRLIGQVAVALARRLAEIDPAHAADYQRRQADFAQRWQAAITRWERAAAPLRGQAIVVQHRGFPYLERWLGLVNVGALEPKPGLEPTSAHLAEVLAGLQRRPARMILRTAAHDGRGAQWLAERTRLPVVVLPYTVGGNEAATDLFSLFDDTIARLLKGLAP